MSRGAVGLLLLSDGEVVRSPDRPLRPGHSTARQSDRVDAPVEVVSVLDELLAGGGPDSPNSKCLGRWCAGDGRRAVLSVAPGPMEARL